MGKTDKKAKKYEDSVSENSIEDNKSNDSESIGEMVKPIEKINNISTVSPKKTMKKTENVKKIDLGAALHYGKDDISPTKQSSGLTDELSFETNNKIPENKSNEQLLDEIFNSGSDSVQNNSSHFSINNNKLNNNQIITNNNNNNIIKNNLMEQFADFSSFDSKSNAINSSSDDFADFATALTTPQTSTQTAQSSQNVLSEVFLQSSNPFVGNTSPVNPLESLSAQNSSDILGDVLTPMPVNSNARPTELLTNWCGTQPPGPESMVSQNNTWSDLSKNVNINVDNLMGSKYERHSVPSMNQLAQKVNNLSLGSPNAPIVRPTASFNSGVTPVSAQQPFAQQMPFGLN